MSDGGRIPVLRPDLELEVLDDDAATRSGMAAQVVDRRLKRRIKLDRAGLALYRLIDGRRDVEAIDAALRREGVLIAPQLLLTTLAFFEKNLLLAGPDGDAVAEVAREALAAPGTYRLRPEAPAAPRELHLLPETRHTCVGCGQCCRGYHFGPLTDEEAARLAAETFVEDGDRLDASQKIVDRELEGKTVKVLETREDGRCVFLGEDNLCIVHKEKGAEAKPKMCQAFPLRFTAAPDGRVFGHLQMECFGYHEARKQARPYAERADEVRRVLGIAGAIPVLAPTTRIGDRTLDLAAYDAVERRILSELAAGASTPSAGLAIVAQLLDHLERGDEPQSFSPRALAPTVGDAAVIRAIGTLARELAAEPATSIGGELIGASPQMRRWFADALDCFRGEGDPGELLAVARVADPCESAECAEILTEFLRNEVFSKEWYRAGDLRMGFALTLTRHELTIAGARMQARRQGDDRVSPKALTHALSTVNRSLRALLVESLAERHGAELLEVFTRYTGRSCS